MLQWLLDRSLFDLVQLEYTASSCVRWEALRERRERASKNGGAEGGDLCERGSQEEAGEEPVQVGWTREQDGGTIDEEIRCD